MKLEDQQSSVVVLETIKTIRSMVADDPQIAVETMDSRIKELEDAGRTT